MVKNLPASAGDARGTGLMLGAGRSPGVGSGSPPTYVSIQMLIFYLCMLIRICNLPNFITLYIFHISVGLFLFNSHNIHSVI